MRTRFVALFLGATCLAAQTPSPQPTLLLPAAEVELVTVDVFVTDKQGRPATGLTADDFAVDEDGQRMRVVNFSDGSSPAPEAQVSVPDAPPRRIEDPAAVPPERRVHVAVYVDNRRLNPANRKRVLERLQALFVNRPAGERVLVASRDGGFVVRQPFTDDMAAVRGALEGLEKGSSVGAETEAELRHLVWRLESADVDEAQALMFQLQAQAEKELQRTRESLAELTRFVELLGGLQGRKIVFYVSDGLSGRPGEALFQAWANRFGEPGRRTPGERGTDPTFQQVQSDVARSFSSLFSESGGQGSFRDVVVRANANRVTLYAVDASFASPSFAGVSADLAGASGGLGDVRAWDQATETMYRQDLTGSLSYLADFTGGRKLPANDSLTQRMQEVRESLAAAYQLAYEPPHVGDGKFHKIDVKVRKPGLEVRHRQGYRDKPADERVADGAYAALLEAGENPLGMALESGKPQPDGKGGFNLPVIVKLPAGRLGLLEQPGQDVGRLTLSFVVQDAKGGLSVPQLRAVPLRFPSGTVKPGTTQTIGYPVPLSMKPGEYQVAVSVRDEISGKRSAAVLRIKL